MTIEYTVPLSHDQQAVLFVPYELRREDAEKLQAFIGTLISPWTEGLPADNELDEAAYDRARTEAIEDQRR
jgi:hypothetical protein